MLTLITLIIIGILLGAIFKSNDKLFKISNFISTYSVYILLIFMGLSTATKNELFSRLREVGAVSIILCFSGILGSIIALIPIQIILKKRKKLIWSFLELKTSASEPIDPLIRDEIKQSPQVHSSNAELRSQDVKKHLSAEMFLPVLCFIIAFAFAKLFNFSHLDWIDQGITYSLYLLIFFTGIGIGRQNVIHLIKKYHIFVILIPIFAMIGSILSGLITSLLIPRINPINAMAICSGMGYYSISAIICTQNLGEIIGVIALLSNLLRELITMLFAPLMVKLFGTLAPIASGGATAMDTTLPFIKKSSGNEYAIIGFISGVILTVLVPIITAIFH